MPELTNLDKESKDNTEILYTIIADFVAQNGMKLNDILGTLEILKYEFLKGTLEGEEDENNSFDT